MLLRIGRFELEIARWAFYIRVPGVGEVFWSKGQGLTVSAASEGRAA